LRQASHAGIAAGMRDVFKCLLKIGWPRETLLWIFFYRLQDRCL
jgi:hypothetical protein